MRTRQTVTYDPEIQAVMLTAGAMSPAVAEATEYSFPDNMVDRIVIDSPEREYRLVDSTDGKIHITATVMAATPGEVAMFKRGVRTNVGRREIGIVVVGGSSYSCGKSVRTINGVTERMVNGICVDDVVIALPRGGRTQVVYNGVPARGIALSGPAQLAEMVRRQSFDNEKLALIEQFVRERRMPIQAEHLTSVLPQFSFDDGKVEAARLLMSTVPGSGRMIYMSDVIALVRSLSFDSGKIQLCDALSGHVLDPHNAYLVMNVISSSSNHMPAVQALSR
jgi:hypothetical protein